MPLAESAASATPAGPDLTRRTPRRALLTGLGAAAATVVAARPAAASVVGTETPERITGMTADERHLVRRLSFGLDGRIASQINRAGGVQNWLTRQLSPETVPDPRGDEVSDWFPDLSLTPQQMWARFNAGRTVTSTTISEDLVRWTLMKRLNSTRQVHEVMSDFWSNLLHVSSPNDKSWVWRPHYDSVIRTHALGRFDEMLKAAVLHPAMLLYLDAYRSTKVAPNENLGRELLELHTVGREAGYGEDGVLNSTRILTGWAVDRSRTWNPSYKPNDHYVGPVKVMDFTHANGSADGQAVAYAYLDYLAHHPATAQRIARRLVTRLVSDTPSETLVADVAAVFLSSGTDIKTTLRALIDHPEFLSSATPKVRTPAEDYVATCRALRMKALKPSLNADLGNYSIWQATSIGPRPFNWPTPDGFPDVSDAWASATRMLGSWDVHHALANGWVKSGVEYRPLSTWVPALPVTFAQLVDAVALRLLFEPATPEVVTAAAAAVGVAETETITADHRVVTQRLPLLLAALLDSPLHMNR